MFAIWNWNWCSFIQQFQWYNLVCLSHTLKSLCIQNAWQYNNSWAWTQERTLCFIVHRYKLHSIGTFSFLTLHLILQNARFGRSRLFLRFLWCFFSVCIIFWAVDIFGYFTRWFAATDKVILINTHVFTCCTLFVFYSFLPHRTDTITIIITCI